MAHLHLLGTGAALSDPHRTTTMLAFRSADSVVLVDCGGDVVQRAMAAGLALEGIRALILTHEHADHVGGFPLFMEKIWLAGRRRAIPVFGPRAALDQARRMFETFNTADWVGMPAIEWHEVGLAPGSPVFDDECWRIVAAPGTHGVPVIGLRVEDLVGGGVAAYSCDTAPCAEIARLAAGADVLVHEATGDFPGHTTASGAARIAAEAGARRLLLGHLPPERALGGDVLEEARRIFPRTEKGEEMGCYEFP